MTRRANFRFVRLVILFLLVSGATLKSVPSIAGADGAPQRNEAPAGKPERSGEAIPEPGIETGKAGDNKPGPETPEDRDRILGDLYKRLSKADNPDFAKLVETAIHKLWSISGSDTVDLLMKRAQILLGKEDEKAALRLLNAVIGLEPRYAEGWNRRAFVHFSRKDYGAALRDLQKVLLIDPRHYKAIGGLAVILREYGRKKAALKAFRKVLEINPLDADTLKAIKQLELEVEGQAI